MRNIALQLATVVMTLLILGSCSKNKEAEVGDLLSTIPSDVSVVAATDVSKFAEDLNSKGIDASVVALFLEGQEWYLTGFVKDTDQFTKNVEQKSKAKFIAKGDISVCKNYAINGNRFWMLIDSLGTIDNKTIQHFCDLSERQSFQSNAYSEKILKLDHDIMVWGDVKACLNELQMDFGQKAMLNVIINSVFSEPVSLACNMDFGKDNIACKIELLNSKGDYSKLLISPGKIKKDVLNGLNGTADGLFAVQVDRKTIEMMQQSLKDQKGLASLLSGIIGCVDGTCAVALGEDDALKGVIQTNGVNVNGLSGALSMIGMNVKMDGNNMLFDKGVMKGKSPISDLSKGMEDALIAISLNGIEQVGGNDVKHILLTVKPSKGGALLNLDVALNLTTEAFVKSLLKKLD